MPPRGIKKTTLGETDFYLPEDYKLTKAIGVGAYGVVALAEIRSTGQKVAVKKITDAFTDAFIAKRLLREVKLLRFFKHDNIVALLDMIMPSDYSSFRDIYMVFELLDTDLQKIINSKQGLSGDHVRFFIYQTLRAMKYIHSAHILHRDLKPGNLLVNANCDLKVCDFNLSRGVQHQPGPKTDDLTEYVVTRWYRSPELVINPADYDYKIDVWSVGCIMAELIRRKPLFPAKNFMHHLNLIIDVLGSPSESDLHFAEQDTKDMILNMPHVPKLPLEMLFQSADKDAVALLEGMLAFDPAKRFTIEQCLAHPYFADLHDEADEPNAPASFEFELENQDIAVEKIKQLMYDEIVDFNKSRQKS